MEVDGENSSSVPTVVDENETSASDLNISVVLEFLRKRNLKAAESALLQETGGSAPAHASGGSAPGTRPESDRQLSSADLPESYSWNYTRFVEFVDTTLDFYKHELSLLLYPVFAHMYLDLLCNHHEEQAGEFLEKFAIHQEDFYSEYLDRLKSLKKKEHVEGDLLISTFRTSKYTVKMARETLMHMKKHLQEQKMTTFLSLVQDHLTVETYDGSPRNRMQTVLACGGLIGETKKDINRSKVSFGLLKEPEITLPADDDDETEEGDKPKKKNRRKDAGALKKAKNDPNAPNINRIPLPEMRDIDKLEKINAYKDSLKRVQISSSSPPSICFYTFLNNFARVSCATFSDDSNMLAAGFENSQVQVWTLSIQKLRAMKSGDALSELDKESDDIMELIMDESTASESKTLVGHAGPVYSVCFSPDKQYLLSSSEDGTVRLWSLMTWTNIVCYKGHNYPVFDAQFSPLGYYFVSGGHDRLARLWSTDHYQPLRLFAGHYSDVDCVKFHHNCNYVATGSADRCIRLYDMLNGNCVRVMCGHKATILSLAFSPCGRFLASASADHMVNIWDISNGVLISQLAEHTAAVISLVFSREGSVLATGGMDNLICIWDVSSLTSEDRPLPDINTQQLHELVALPLLSSFPTKSTPPICLHFTRRNLLLGTGTFTS